VNAGFRGLMLGDTAVYFDLYLAAGTAFVFNSRYLDLFLHEDANFAWTGWHNTIPQGQLGSIGVQVTAAELVCRQPNTGMQIQGITGGVV
ncbi:MAG: hypothetical protein ACREFX_04730, partial [Opitutaceae bacterium]